MSFPSFFAPARSSEVKILKEVGIGKSVFSRDGPSPYLLDLLIALCN